MSPRVPGLVSSSRRSGGGLRMDEDIDPERIDDAVLALLWLGLHDGWRAWKGFDWGALDRLHRKGMISNPASKAKSVVFTEEGRRKAERLFHALFARR
jgi:hypothetical protein